MKKHIALSVVLFLSLSMFPVSAALLTEGPYTYFVQNGTAHLESAEIPASGQLVLPDTLGGYPLTHVGGFSQCTELRSIVIPQGVTTLSGYAFEGCASLESVALPEGLVTVEAYAFFGCSKLSEIQLPDSVWYVGTNSFAGTAWFEAQPQGLVYLNKVLYKIKGECPTGHVEIREGTVALAENAFCCDFVEPGIEECCDHVTSLSLPDSLRVIPAPGFSMLKGLTKLELPVGLVYATCLVKNADLYITDLSAFLGSQLRGLWTESGNLYLNGQLLTDLVIPSEVEQIPSMILYGCSSLRSLTIGSHVKSIGYTAFTDCSSLTDIHITSNTALSYHVFKNTAWYNQQPKDQAMYLGNILYEYGENQSNIAVVREGTEAIAAMAFGARGKDIQRLYLPASLQHIGLSAFLLRYKGTIECVQYLGTKEQATNIVVEAGNQTLLDAAWSYKEAARETQPTVTTTCATTPVTAPSDSQPSTNGWMLWVAAGAATLAVLGLAAWVVLRRRKKAD